MTERNESDYTDDTIGFDQTNDVIDLEGDDGGSDDAVDPDEVDPLDIVDVESLLDGDDAGVDDHNNRDGSTAEDRDPAVGGYSEEGAL